MTNPVFVLLITVAIIGLSAFFVAVEFALIAAKRHRLEDAAASSRSARAALRSANELTLLLAGSQLGITVCTLALGAITKPAVHHWLTPVFASWGLPPWGADVAGFVMALAVVTFLHLVIGEMAPKSWAIAHPERSATMLALPMRGFMWVTRPLLRALNAAANAVLVKIGVSPADQISKGQNPEDLRHLVEHSVNVGALDASFSVQISGALDLETLTVKDLLAAEDQPLSAVYADASMTEVRRVSRASGHLRLLVTGATGNGASDVVGVIHVRDTLTVPAGQKAAGVARAPFVLQAATPVYAALTEMRQTRNHMAVVRDGDETVGVITLADVLRRLFPQSTTETSRQTAAPSTM